MSSFPDDCLPPEETKYETWLLKHRTEARFFQNNHEPRPRLHREPEPESLPEPEPRPQPRQEPQPELLPEPESEPLPKVPPTCSDFRRFSPRNHSVVRASYRYPCIPIEHVKPTVRGFYSGPKPVAADEDEFAVRINDTEPIFYYCSTPHSCVYKGMVGVINPVRRRASRVRSAPLTERLQLSPGDAYPTEGPPGPAETVVNGPGRSPVGCEDGAGQGLGTNQGVGIALGATAALIGLAVIAAVCLFGKRMLRQQQQSSRVLPRAAPQPKSHGLVAASRLTDRPPSEAVHPQAADSCRLSSLNPLQESSDDRTDVRVADMSDSAHIYGWDAQAYVELPGSLRVSQFGASERQLQGGIYF
ncbi:extracellular serine-rich protein [Verticillium dahliae]